MDKLPIVRPQPGVVTDMERARKAMQKQVLEILWHHYTVRKDVPTPLYKPTLIAAALELAATGHVTDCGKAGFRITKLGRARLRWGGSGVVQGGEPSTGPRKALEATS